MWSDQRLVPLGPAEEVGQRCRTDQAGLLLQKLDLNINIISIIDLQNIPLQETDLKQNILAPQMASQVLKSEGLLTYVSSLFLSTLPSSGLCEFFV